MQQEEKLVLSGVLVDPISREQFGARVTVQGGIVESIAKDSSITAPYILPGFIDSHVHIESSMLTPQRFAQMAVKHGTVAVVTDPHEVANVAGRDGVYYMLENAKSSHMKFFFGVPSCVPAAPHEKSGAELTAPEVKEMLESNDFFLLAEMMNFPGVIFGDLDVKLKLEAAKAAKKPTDGHAPGLFGDDLKRYVEAGISTDHECSTMKEAEEKVKLGMSVLIREGSAAKNFDNLIPLIEQHPNKVMFCTDDCHPDYLTNGHINILVKRAIAMGYNIYDVLMAACVNPVQHYNLPVGYPAIGQVADFIVVDSLIDFNVKATIVNGVNVLDKSYAPLNPMLASLPSFPFRTSHTQGKLGVIAKSTHMNVMVAIDGELITEWAKESVPVNIGEPVCTNSSDDLLKIVLIDRYSNFEPVVGFIRGFGIKHGAMAASIAHDSHHIISVGVDDESIDRALTWVVESRGGMCFANKESIHGIRLPVFGLMSEKDGQDVASEYEKLNQLVKISGSTLAAPFMTMSFMALTVIPKLKIFHGGLFDVASFKPVDLFE